MCGIGGGGFKCPLFEIDGQRRLGPSVSSCCSPAVRQKWLSPLLSRPQRCQNGDVERFGSCVLRESRLWSQESGQRLRPNCGNRLLAPRLASVLAELKQSYLCSWEASLRASGGGDVRPYKLKVRRWTGSFGEPGAVSWFKRVRSSSRWRLHSLTVGAWCSLVAGIFFFFFFASSVPTLSGSPPSEKQAPRRPIRSGVVFAGANQVRVYKRKPSALIKGGVVLNRSSGVKKKKKKETGSCSTLRWTRWDLKLVLYWFYALWFYAHTHWGLELWGRHMSLVQMEVEQSWHVDGSGGGMWVHTYHPASNLCSHRAAILRGSFGWRHVKATTDWNTFIFSAPRPPSPLHHMSPLFLPNIRGHLFLGSAAFCCRGQFREETFTKLVPSRQFLLPVHLTTVLLQILVHYLSDSICATLQLFLAQNSTNETKHTISM